MEGDSLPVSAFMDHADGQFEQGASAYEKRGVAVMVPHWDADKCIQCNQCSFVCPHATIRPFGLTEDEIANAPEGMRTLDIKMPKDTGLKFTMAISPLDCMGCTNCVEGLPEGRPHHGAAGAGARGAGRPSTTASRTSRRSPCSRPPTSRAASSSSRCLSSPAPALVAPRPRTHAWSPRSAATACSSPTPPAAPPSGATRLPARPTRSTPRATVRRGTTRSSRTTPSTVWACSLVTRPSRTSSSRTSRPCARATR